MDHKPEDLAEFFRTRKIGFGRCLEPTMQCGEPAIRAHSIQNRQTIELLERDNHVIAWQPRFSGRPRHCAQTDRTKRCVHVRGLLQST